MQRGQLGYNTGGNLIQQLPRKVTVLPLETTVIKVIATDFATVCFLSSEIIYVLHQHNHYKLSWNINRFEGTKGVYRPPQAGPKTVIKKIVGSGTDLVAVSSLGDVLHWTLEDPASAESASNFNNRAPQRIWDPRKQFNAVVDAAIGQNAIVLCTVSGHVFVRTRRVEIGSGIKGVELRTPIASSRKLFKFNQIPYLQRIVCVAANPAGGFAAIRADVRVPRIPTLGTLLSQDILSMLPFWDPMAVLTSNDSTAALSSSSEDEDDEDLGRHRASRHLLIGRHYCRAASNWAKEYGELSLGTDLLLVTTKGKQIPVHSALLAARSPFIADALEKKSLKKKVARNNASDIHFTLNLPPCSLFACLLVLHYIYSDEFPRLWDIRIAAVLQAEFPTLTLKVFRELMADVKGLAKHLQLTTLFHTLESSLHVNPPPTFVTDFSAWLSDTAVRDSNSVHDSGRSWTTDSILKLSDGTLHSHSVILQSRSPLFRAMFADEEWTSQRRDADGIIHINLENVSVESMTLVLRYLYTDVDEHLFDETRMCPCFPSLIIGLIGQTQVGRATMPLLIAYFLYSPQLTSCY